MTGFGFGLMVSWIICLIVCWCRIENAIEYVCRSEYENLVQYENCVEETRYFRDLEYKRKVKTDKGEKNV